MKTIDRYIIRSFLFCCLIVFLVFMSLRIIGDLFVNMDEFVKGGDDTLGVIGQVLYYYGGQSLLYITELGGVVITFSASFTLARMNRTNELTALLASGVSLYRVLLPIVVCSILLGGVIIIDREVLIPRIADRLALDRSERAGKDVFQVRLLSDTDHNVWFAQEFSPAHARLSQFLVVLRDNRRVTGRIVGREAYAGAWTDDQGRRGGWFSPDAEVMIAASNPQDLPPSDGGGAAGDLLQQRHWQWPQSATWIYTSVDPAFILETTRAARPDAAGAFRIVDNDYTMVITSEQMLRDETGYVLYNPVFTFHKRGPGGGYGEMFAAVRALRATWQEPGSGSDARRGHWRTSNGSLFIPTDLSPDDILLRQSNRWVEYTSTAQLNELLTRDRAPDRRTALMAKHIRVTEPINNLVMLLLAVPFILSRERNVKTSMGLCVIVVGLFYVSMYLVRFIEMDPVWAAWLPALAFGPIAAISLDSIKT